MTEDLRDQLTDIRGVGDATADEIFDVLTDYEDSGVSDDLRENITAAWDYYENGQESYAEKYLRRAYEEVAGDAP